MLRKKEAFNRVASQKKFLICFWRSLHQEHTTELNRKSQQNFVEIIGKKLNIRQLDDWYNIDSKAIADVGTH